MNVPFQLLALQILARDGRIHISTALATFANYMNLTK